MTTPTPPIDIQPLVDRFHGNQSELARHLHIHHSRINKALRTGITIHTADKWAIRLGYHPTEIWADWYQKENA